MTRPLLRRFEWYALVCLWLTFTFAGWGLSGLLVYWKARPEPVVLEPLPPLLLQDCKSVRPYLDEAQ